jgi:hypothetical protein
MSDPRRRDDEFDEDLALIPGTGGIAGSAGAMTPSDNSIFGPEPDPEPDSRGVNEEDVSMNDAELTDSGSSPEFDHSLKRRKS